MAVSLAEIILALGVPARDNLIGTTTSDAGTPNQMVDATRRGQVANTWVGSEVLFYSGLGPTTGLNPKLVTAFDNTTGTFTLSDNWATGNGVPANTPYALINIRGKGFPFQYRRDAVTQALAAMASEGTQVEVTVSGGAVVGQYVYDIPDDGIDTVHTVSLRSLATDLSFWELGIPGNKWELRPGRRILINRRGIGNTPSDIVLRGRYYPTVSTRLSDTFNVQKDEVVNLALEFLTLLSANPAEARANQNLMQERLRFGGDYAYPNERAII